MNIRHGFGIRDSVQKFLRRGYVRAQTRHLHGPVCFELNENDVALVLLGRNILHSAPYFLDYYRARGISKFIYMDNGSKDGSELFFCQQPDAIVVQCLLNFRDWQPELRYVVASDYAVGGWRLALDADEILDYQGSNRTNIPQLAAFLSECGFTGLVAQMLEMVPRGSLRAFEKATFAECVDTFTSYSTDAIETNNYHSSADPLHFFASKNRVSNPAIKIMRGGLRRTVFGEDCLLLKHVLYKDGPGVLPLPHPHFTCGLHLADFTAVLYHYKFAGPYIYKERALEQEGRLSHGEGLARLEVMQKLDDIVFDFEGLREGPTIEGLIAQKFLVEPLTSDPNVSLGASAS